MDFAQQQRSPGRHLFGLGTVLLMHILVVYALVTGLARKVVEVIKQPIETKIIEELKKPPPDTPPPPPPKLVVPPPPFIPPPEVNIQVQGPAINTITAVTNVKPPPAVVVPKVEAPPPPPKPAVTNVAVACPNVRAIAGEIAYPSRAQKEGVYSGEVVIQFTLGANGEVVNPTVIKSSNRVFNNAALDGARLLKCVGGGKDTVVQWPIGFKVD